MIGGPPWTGFLINSGSLNSAFSLSVTSSDMHVGINNNTIREIDGMAIFLNIGILWRRKMAHTETILNLHGQTADWLCLEKWVQGESVFCRSQEDFV